MKIGQIDIPMPLLLAPMEDVTDAAFRSIAKKLGADILYTEFASSEALIRNAVKTVDKIQISQTERPVAIQIFGGLPSSIEGAVRISEKLSPDFIDINCGCWVRKVAFRGEGAGLLRDLKKLESVVKAAVSATKLPVTVKTRLGWDEKSIVILEAARIIEQAGAKALAVHCRTRDQGYKGFADWSWLEKIRKILSIPLIGNGDVRTPMDVKRLFETGCDGVMIGRAAVSNPWIFNQSKYFLKTGDLLPQPDLKERIEICLEHLGMILKVKGKAGFKIFRKFYGNYLKGMPEIAPLKLKLYEAGSFEEVETLLHDYENRTLN